MKFIESYKAKEQIYTFVFEKPEDLNWKAGQHGLYDITHKKIKNKTRPFSIPTAPHENTIHITTRIGKELSEFKQALLELKPGMSMRLTGPVGSFYLK
ncbi:FAD-binding oxidoreductase [Alkalibacterium indicireducens]|uniref:FAD-binding oxidoreductase n=1 Tax=Alkalibacterium indicireducens TaxID=398758 RepID=UPI0031F74CB8